MATVKEILKIEIKGKPALTAARKELDHFGRNAGKAQTKTKHLEASFRNLHDRAKRLSPTLKIISKDMKALSTGTGVINSKRAMNDFANAAKRAQASTKVLNIQFRQLTIAATAANPSMRELAYSMKMIDASFKGTTVPTILLVQAVGTLTAALTRLPPPARRVARSTREVGTSAKKAGAELTFFDKSLQQATLTAKIAEGPLGGTAARLTNIAVALKGATSPMGIAIAGFSVLAAGVGYGTLQLARFNIELSRVQARFTTVAGSINAGKVMFGEVSQVAKDLRIDLMAASDGYSRLRVAGDIAGFSAQETMQIYKGLATASSALALDQNEVTGAIRAVVQMMSKGKIMSEELRLQLAERFPGAVALMAQAVGVGTAELFKMMEQGQLTTEHLVPFGKLLEDKFAEGAASDNAAKSMQELTNAFTELKIALVDSSFDTAMQGFLGWVTGLVDSTAGVIELNKNLETMASIGIGLNKAAYGSTVHVKGENPQSYTFKDVARMAPQDLRDPEFIRNWQRIQGHTKEVSGPKPRELLTNNPGLIKNPDFMYEIQRQTTQRLQDQIDKDTRTLGRGHERRWYKLDELRRRIRDNKAELARIKKNFEEKVVPGLTKKLQRPGAPGPQIRAATDSYLNEPLSKDQLAHSRATDEWAAGMPTQQDTVMYLHGEAEKKRAAAAAAQKESARRAAEAAKEREKLLDDEIATYNKASAAKVRAIQKNAAAERKYYKDRFAEQDKMQANLEREAETYIRMAETPMERYNQQLERMAILHEKGVLSSEQMTAAQAKMRDQLRQTEPTLRILNNSIGSFADSLIDAGVRGRLTFQNIKQGFSEMVYSILADMAKLQIRNSIVGPLTDLLGSAISGGISGYFNGGVGGGGGGGSGAYIVNTPSATVAKGGVFSNGVQKFAKGGVVSSPTIFPMASGYGLMGEAGPEAVMPLTRGPDGNLGVRAQSGTASPQVYVNVENNNAAQTSVDVEQDGNIINIVLNAMVSDINRKGRLHSAMKRNFSGLNNNINKRG